MFAKILRHIKQGRCKEKEVDNTLKYVMTAGLAKNKTFIAVMTRKWRLNLDKQEVMLNGEIKNLFGISSNKEEEETNFEDVCVAIDSKFKKLIFPSLVKG